MDDFTADEAKFLQDLDKGLQREHRPKRGLWAPGCYSNVCMECGQHFVGDERALHCADCAYKDE